MKSFFILFLIVVFSAQFSCNKTQDKVCYKCTFGLVGSTQEPPRTVCLNQGEKIEQQRFTDSNGNELSSFCVKQ